MLSKQEITQWLIDNASDERGNIDLSNLDFRGKVVKLNGIIAYEINNYLQEANVIRNFNQIGQRMIDNSCQRGESIRNVQQKAQRITNSRQKITKEKYEANIKLDRTKGSK